jgi:hypothetical protein
VKDIVKRVVVAATIVRKRDDYLRLKTRAIRCCQMCGKTIGQPRTEDEYSSDVDVCGSDCWRRMLRDGV